MKRLLNSLTWKQMPLDSDRGGSRGGGLWRRFRAGTANAISGRSTARFPPKTLPPYWPRSARAGPNSAFRTTGRRCWFPPPKWPSCACSWPRPGIPKSGRIGFELFDKTNFGASDFAEQVNYHRALEGELERSVMSLAEVEQAARSHHVSQGFDFPGIAPAGQSQRSGEAAGGRAAIGAECGGHLPADRQRRGRTGAGGCFGGGHARESAEQGAQGAVSGLIQRAIRGGARLPAEDRDETCWQKSTPRLSRCSAPDKFRATASVECDFTSAEQSEETFDPNKSVMVTSQKTEDISGGTSATRACRARLPTCRGRLRVPASAGRTESPGAPRISPINPAIRCVTCASRRATSKRCRFRSWWIPTCAGRARGQNQAHC